MVMWRRGFGSFDVSGVPAFVFDIDGVLVRGKNVLPQAKEVMRLLYGGNDKEMPLLPFCFMTNSVGITEKEKAEQLTNWLNVPIREEQVILSHTPMRTLVEKYKNDSVLVSGRHKVSAVAEHYGFKSIFTTQQLSHAFPSATPFSQKFSAHSLPQKYDGQKIGAILVMNDPEDWYLDFQIITDIIRGNGIPGKIDSLPHTVPVYFSNPDLVWANEFPVPRFGQGAFAKALNALYKELTGEQIRNQTYFGKPNPAPYALAQQILEQESQLIDVKSIGKIYALGDNPAADIRGANRAGNQWTSVLVHTGVFQAEHNNCQIDPAQLVAGDVFQAVKLILSKYGY
eukprot:TRINITY_DN32926_c1_g1_i1.p1 TRINITY_DN32926_c1_g1~~TRINITY_DN32926_c1_g1_i1.p1  ORF type:complete len:341 (+),score=36.28 TRINITY_DN32926_c1_g1_i1:42-1064(+)